MMPLRSVFYLVCFVFSATAISKPGIYMEGVHKGDGGGAQKNLQYFKQYQQGVLYRIEHYPTKAKKRWDMVMISAPDAVYSCTREQKVCMKMPPVKSLLPQGVESVDLKILSYKVAPTNKYRTIDGKKCRVSRSFSKMSMTVPFTGEQKTQQMRIERCHYKPKKYNYAKFCNKMANQYRKSTKIHPNMVKECKLGFPVTESSIYKDLDDGSTMRFSRKVSKFKEINFSSRYLRRPKGYKLMEMPNMGNVMEQYGDMIQQAQSQEQPKRSRGSASNRKGFVSKTKKDVQSDSEKSVNEAIRKKANSELQKGLKNVFGF